MTAAHTDPFPGRIAKAALILMLGASIALPQVPPGPGEGDPAGAVAAGAVPEGPGADSARMADSAAAGDSGDGELIFDGDLGGGPPLPGPGESFFDRYVMGPMRLTLKHEVSFNAWQPEAGPRASDFGAIRNNRTSLRLEYSKFFLDHFSARLDSRIAWHWGNDHRGEGIVEDVLSGSGVREAYLQASFLGTSVKAGMQKLIWGESDGGAITDVISPRYYSEIFFTTLEESRIGQPMLTVDQFTPVGDWSLFFVPFPAFNVYPEEGSAYYYDPFGGAVDVRTGDGGYGFEYGMKWKKTFGQSDISVMAASLIDNDYVLRMEEPGAVSKDGLRFYLAGVTSNYAVRNFLLKGEVALKSPKAFNDASLEVLERDALDASLGFDYSPGGTFSMSVEGVQNWILDWDARIEGAPDVSNTLVVVLSDRFLNENLNVNWMTTYNEPYTGLLSILSAFYKWNDHVIQGLDVYYPHTENGRSGYYMYRDQKRVSLKLQYQF